MFPDGAIVPRRGNFLAVSCFLVSTRVRRIVRAFLQFGAVLSLSPTREPATSEHLHRLDNVVCHDRCLHALTSFVNMDQSQVVAASGPLPARTFFPPVAKECGAVIYAVRGGASYSVATVSSAEPAPSGLKSRVRTTVRTRLTMTA